MSDAIERLVNLALVLASAREPVSTERVRAEVTGYPENQDDAAFERMFERDKEHLREAGLVIESTPDGLNRLDSHATFVTEVSLSPADTAVIRTIAAALLGDPTYPYAEDLRCAVAKVATLNAAHAPAVSLLADEEPAEQGARVVDISAAATARKRISFSYVNSAGEERTREVEPYGLFVREGRWYVVGRDTALDEVRVFAVPRISALTVNAAKPKSPDFTRPAEFDVATFIGLPFQYGSGTPFEAVVRFTSGSAWRAAGLTSGIGSLAPDADRDDGSLLWTVSARDGRALLRWVVGHGPGIEVASPDDLADELQYGLDEVMAAHG